MAFGQAPALILKADVRLSYLNTIGLGSRVRWYDPMGRHSLVGMTMIVEPGYYVRITERLQRIDGDPDRELIDEAFVEDPGNWRVGRQYLPFGTQVVVREAALAARSDRLLTVRKLPVVFALFDNGAGKPRGVVGRIGTWVGVSLAYGEHLCTSGTSLTAFRRPEDSPGAGRGYALVGGFDATRSFGPATVQIEYVGLRRGAAAGDRSEDATDLRATIRPFQGSTRIVAGWSRTWRAKEDFYRLESEQQLSRNVSLEAFVRFQRSAFTDFAVGTRIRF